MKPICSSAICHWMLACLLSPAAMTYSATVSPEVVDRPDASKPNRHYAGNRAPLSPSPLIKLPIGSIRPEGWTRQTLRLQADGFHGHLTEISAFLKKEGNAWLNPAGRGDHGWEEPPYWLKGFQDCAYLLQDEAQMKEARLWIEGAIRSQQPDGWFGPGEGRIGLATDLQGRADLWPNMIMLFCLQSFHEQTGDPRVLELMTKYFRYLSAVPEAKFLPGYWPKMRAGDQIHSILWLYNRTGETALLELAHKTHRQAARWDQDVINWHNVNLAQGFREPAVYWQLSLDPQHLEATYRNWLKIRDLYGQVPGGMFGADENARPGYTGPRQAIESCGIVEETLSAEILLGITGDLIWADRCEDAAFNSLPAALTADFKALRYLTAPNQPQSDHVSKSPGIQNGGPMYHMNPHDHRCCQHNVGHGWPYFVQHLWYASPADGLAAVLYAPCTVTAKVGGGTEVTIREETQYPFEDAVRFTFQAAEAVRFPLHLRVPGWCEGAELRLNGQRLSAAAQPGAYLRLDREWKSGDRVELRLPMEVKLRTWEKNRRTVSIDRGPLTYALEIQEKYVRHGGTDAWPAWDILPSSPWNYGLVFDAKRPARSFAVQSRPWPADNQPFGVNASPIALGAKGRRIPAWQLDKTGLVREVQAGPVRSSEPLEDITLIPMGAARLRIAAFPVIGEGPEAREWAAPKPLPVTASHCNDSDTEDAVNDGILPKNSGDTSIPRFTWWDHRGSQEWVQWDLGAPRKVSEVEVYWFDDTGVGQCRIPASWQLCYRKSGQWVPVANASAFGVDKDRFNETTFDAVTTDALRIDVQLREGFSGGVLEWRVPN